MNKKKFLAVLSIPAIVASLGLTVPNMIDNTHNNSNIKLLMNNEVQSTTNYYRKLPNSWTNKPEFEYMGLKYVRKDNYYSPQVTTNPENIKEVYLTDYLFDSYRLTSSIDFSQYTNLEDVIVNNANIHTYTRNSLKTIKSGKNLYLANGINFEEFLSTSTFENIYLCPQISIRTGFLDGQTKEALGFSNVKNIYYNDYAYTYMKSNIDNLKNSNPTNKNGETINILPISGSIKYPKEMFYIRNDFDGNSRVFGAETEFYSENDNVKTLFQTKERIINLDSRVHDLNLRSTVVQMDTLPRDRKYGKISCRVSDDYSSLRNLQAEELELNTIMNSTIDLTLFSQVEAIRFVTGRPYNVTVTGEVTPESKLKKIYIPKTYETEWRQAFAGKGVDSYIEVFDEINYKEVLNSYIDSKGTKILVEDSRYSVDDIELQKQYLEALGLDLTGKVIDVVAKEYEVAHKTSNNAEVYGIEDIRTLVVSKNKDAKEVVRDILQYIVRQGDYHCDVAGFSIKSIDDSQYTIGKNGLINITYKLPNNAEFVQSVLVRTIPTVCDESYIIDGYDNITVLTPKSATKSNLSKLMKPIMDDFFMETNPHYTESEVLDTTILTYNCGNKYSISDRNGKVRVSTYEQNTTPPVVQPDTKPEGSLPEEKPNPTPTPNPEQGTTPTDKDPNSNTEGLLVNEITAIYTNTQLDGWRVLGQLTDQLLTYNGKPLNFPFGSTSGINNNNDKDYTFEIFGNVLNNDYIERTINVKVSNYNRNLAFVLFKDGKLIVAQNYHENYPVSEIKAGVEEFLRSQNIDATNVVVPTYDGSTQLYTGGSYSGGELLFLNSGPTLTFNTADKPVDQSHEMKGYQGINNIYYTEDFTVEQVLRALSRNYLLKDGIYDNSNYKISFKYVNGSSHARYDIRDSNNVPICAGYVNLYKVKSKYKYIIGKPINYDHCYMLIDKVATKPTYTLNDVLKDAISQFRGLMRPFDNQTNIDFTVNGHADVDGVYQLGNSAYYKYQYDVDVVDINYTIKTNKCTFNGMAEAGTTVNDKVSNFFQTLKEKFTTNKAFKIVSITIGSITGLLLLYGAYILIRKSIKWFKK